MPVEAELKPSGPYSLRLSGRLASDQTRVVRGGVYDATISAGDRLERVVAVQRTDGTILVQSESEAGVDHVRFALGLDDDHSELLRRFAHDPLIGEATRRLRGLRPLRTATVAHSLLRAVSGQLIQAKRARQIEASVIRSTGRAHDSLYAAPSSAELGARSPAELARLGLGARRASTLVRLCRSLDLESLKYHPTEQVARRLEREPGLGPWSVGVVCLQGLGRYERGLARDLGLVKLVSLLRGRRAEPEETDELLAPYGEWAGLASIYLLASFHAGYIRFPDGGRRR
jgi:3-methyladenine DNA glycosylase/8-oxoguanine DNA glycosylase